MIKAIIFDCFGVLYPDTLSLVGRPYLKGNDPKHEELRYLRRQCDLGQLSRDEFWDGAAKIIGVTRAQLNAELDKVRGADWDLLEYIKGLKPKYKTGLLSNVGGGFLERVFEGRPPGDYFDELVASAEIGVLKPDRRAFEITAERLGVDPTECIMIDDQLRHCDGARAVGMKAIVYQDFEQCKTDLEKLLADANR